MPASSVEMACVSKESQLLTCCHEFWNCHMSITTEERQPKANNKHTFVIHDNISQGNEGMKLRYHLIITSDSTSTAGAWTVWPPIMVGLFSTLISNQDQLFI
jgi:hypothetical protein